MVVFSHVLQTYHWTQEVLFVWRLHPGATGVSLFFVISGYLITTLLLRERANHGRIGLRGFYFRRFFRIVPAYLAYVGTVALLALAGLTNVPWADFVRALLYLTNYVEADWLLLHTWSLSVEEQFYLLFPLLLIFTSRQWVVRILLITLGVSVAARGLNQLWGLWPINATYSFEGRADQLAFGCLCALFQQGAKAQLQEQLVVRSINTVTK